MGIWKKSKKHGQSKKRSNDRSSRENDHDEISEFIKQSNVDIHKQYPIVANLEIPEIVPGVALDDVKNAAAEHDGVVQHVAGGYTVIIATNAMLQENPDIGGAVKVTGKKQKITVAKSHNLKTTVFGQLAADLRKSNVTSLTIPANMARGELVLEPNEQTLYRLSDLNTFENFSFRWGVFPEEIEDDAMHTAAEMVGPKEGVTLKDLIGLMRDGTQLRYDENSNSILEGIEDNTQVTQSDDDSDPYNVNTDKIVADATGESGKQSDVPSTPLEDFAMDDNDYEEYGNNDNEPDPQSVAPTSTAPVASESVNSESSSANDDPFSDVDADAPASKASGMSNSDVESWDRVLAGYEAKADSQVDMYDQTPTVTGAPEVIDSPEKVKQNSSTTPDATPQSVVASVKNTVTKLYHDPDDGIFYKEDDFNALFPKRLPMQFLLEPNPNNDMLTNLANQKRANANAKLVSLSDEHYAVLKRVYVIRMNDALNEAKALVSFEDKTTKYGQRYHELVESRDEKIAERDRNVKILTDKYARKYAENRQAYIDERAHQAGIEYDTQNRTALDAQLQAIPEQFEASISTDFAKQVYDLNVARTNVARKALAKMSDDVVQALTLTNNKFISDEQAVFDDQKQKIDLAIENEYNTDTQRQTALATNAENSARLEAYMADNKHLKSDLQNSNEAHAKEISQIKADANNDQSVALSQQKAEYEQTVADLRQKVLDSEKAQRDLQDKTINKNNEQDKDHKTEMAELTTRYENQLAIAREESQTKRRFNITIGTVLALVITIAGIGIGSVGTNIMMQSSTAKQASTQAAASASTPTQNSPIIIQNGSSSESSHSESSSSSEKRKSSSSENKESGNKNSSGHNKQATKEAGSSTTTSAANSSKSM